MRVTTEYIAYVYFKYYEKDFHNIFDEVKKNYEDIDSCDGYLNTKLVRDMKGFFINRSKIYIKNNLLDENPVALNFLVSGVEHTKWENIGRFRIQLAFNIPDLDTNKMLITFSRNSKGEYYYYISTGRSPWDKALNFSDLLVEEYDMIESILSADEDEIINFPEELLPKI